MLESSFLFFLVLNFSEHLKELQGKSSVSNLLRILFVLKILKDGL